MVCGGVRTEPQYLAYVNEALDAVGVHLAVAPSGESPQHLLELAITRRDDERSAARRSGDRGNVFDATWIVCDVDEFAEQLKSIRSDADKQGIQLAVSNPCFEVWLLWHQKPAVGYMTTKQAQAVARKAGVVRGKTLIRTGVEGKYADARRIAQQARQNHVKDAKTFPADNPASDVDVLIESILESIRAARPGLEITL